MQSPEVQEMPTKQPLVNVSLPFFNDWKPGVFRRLPWKGLGAIIGAVVGICAWAAILKTSEGKPITSWTFQPAVYLAIVVAITNVLISFALSEATTIFWWRRSLQRNATLGDLHRNWAQGDSVLSALKSGKHISVLAIATMIASLVPVNGPLLQRASRVTNGGFTSPVTLQLDASPDMPIGFTSMVSGRARAPTVISKAFFPIVRDFSSASEIHVNQAGCQGDCHGMLLNGAGFEVNCSSNTAHFFIGADGTNNGSSGYQVGYATTDGIQIFNTNFHWDSREPETLTIGVQYKPDMPCEGDLQIRNCTLRAANVNYPVIVNGNKSTIALEPSSNMFSDSVIRLSTFPVENSPGVNSTLGGVLLALQNQFASSATMFWKGAVGNEIDSTGLMANKYLVEDNFSTLNCGLTFGDPMEELLAAARELMFRTTVATANGSNLQTLSGMQTLHTPVWKSHYEYLAGAALVTVIAIIVVAAAYYQFWLLGRSVSMSPLEIAKAFGSPLLLDASGNATAEQMVKDQGGRSAVYGITSAQDLQFGPSGDVLPPRRRRE